MYKTIGNSAYSFIIPVYNEQDSLEELYKKITTVSEKELKVKNYEILFINDGSTDKSLEVLKKLNSKDKHVRILSFRVNLGKAAALNAGFQTARGRIIITLDADLQDGPENVPQMVKMLSDSTDMVVGWKKVRRDGADRLILTKIFNFFVRRFSHLSLHDFNCGLKVMKWEVAKEIDIYGELHRFIPVLASQRGFKVTEKAVVHYPRKYGKSKYGWQRIIKGFDLITVMFLGIFGDTPLHFFGFTGLICEVIGFILGLYLSLLHFQGHRIGTRPLLTLTVLLILAGLQIFLTGLIAELIVKGQRHNKDKFPINFET